MDRFQSATGRIFSLFFVAYLVTFAPGCNGDDDTEEDVGVADVGADDVQDGEADVEGDVEEDADAGGEEVVPCPMEFSDDGEMRIFVFGSLIRVEDAVTYEGYDQYFRGQVHEIADCFSDERPNFLVFAEDVGLHAGLIGSRGETARQAGDSQAVFLNLLADYGAIPTAVSNEYPGIDIPRRIFLSLTDTIWRAVDQTFSSIADDYDVWVLTSANVAEVEESTDPADLDLWADPDLEEVESVYVPVDRHVYNTAIIYDPDGELVARVHKPFLTAGEEVELALSYGSLESLRPVQVGPERLGVFTSKDAWMPPANDRLGLLGSTVQVQPEAFGGWTIEQVNEDEWLPDVLTQSGWGFLQKYSSFRYGAMPVLTGNFFELVFDGQAVIWGQAHPGADAGGFVGQQDRPGFLEVGPWAFDDPGEEDSTLTLQERRDMLRELGESMLRGAGEPNENAYVDSVVGRDLGAGFEYTAEGTFSEGAVGPGERVGEPEDSPMQRVRMAASGDRLAMVWQVEKEERQVVMMALMEWNEGDEEYEVLRLDEMPTAGSDTGDMVAPAVAINEAGEAVVIYQWVGPETSILHGFRVSEDDREGLSLPIVEDSSDQWLPALAAEGDQIALVFTDRATGHDRVYIAVSDDGGVSFTVPQPVDAGAEVDAPNTRGIQWHPAVAISGDTVAVAWTDFRAFQWDIYGARSSDGGATFGDAIRLDGAGEGFERIHTDPRLILTDEDTALLAWTYQADRRPETDARYRSWSLIDDELGDEVVLDGEPLSYPTHAWYPAVVSVEGDVSAAWMQLTEDSPQIVMTLAGEAELREVSNPGHIGWWPDLVEAEGRAIVGWIEHEPDRGFSVRYSVSQ